MEKKPPDNARNSLREAIRIRTGEVVYGELDVLSGGSIRRPKMEISVRAPKRPFPWWGPFDATDAIGRTMLILGLCCMAGLFAAAVVFAMEYSSRTWFYEFMIFEFGILFAIILALAGFFGSMGVGILLGKNWGIALFKTILVIVTLTQFVMTIIIALALALFPRGSDAYMKLFSPVSVGASFLLFLGTVYPLWRYWSEDHVRYGFDYIPHEALGKNLYRSTSRFALVTIFSGIMLAATAFMIDIGVWQEMWRYRIYGAKNLFAFLHLLKYLITVAIFLFFPLYARRRGFGKYTTLTGIIALTVLHIPIVTVLAVYGRARDDEVILLTIPVVSAYLLGLVMINAGLGFRNRSDPARRILSFLPLAFLAVAVGYTVYIFADPSTGMWREIGYLREEEMIIVLAFLFPLVVPVYVLIEIYRYFSSDKAKAFCGSGKYMPPWQAQLDLISEHRKESENRKEIAES